MRQQIHNQLPLMDNQVNHSRAREFERISRILDANPIISKMVLQDISKGVKKQPTGARGMTADQVLRAAIVKQKVGYVGLSCFGENPDAVSKPETVPLNKK